MWRGLFLCFVVSFATASVVSLQKEHPCDNKECRSGRECVVVDGEPQCLCIVSCPDHFKPVCGTDGVSYDNHCRLHQKACVSGHHISIKHKGYCKASYEKRWKEKMEKKSLLSKHDLENELQNDLIEILKKNENKELERNKGPAVCYTPQRNALRFLLVEHFEEDLKQQSWYLEGMTYRESLWGWFYTCDEDKNNFVNAEELLSCSRKVDLFARPGQDNELTKELCIDALVDDGDKNRDWKLDFEEFTTIMDPKYEPKEKKCSLEGRDYLDGEEVNVECSHCVCAVGNWICASSCADNIPKKKDKSKKNHKHGRPLPEIDNAIDDSNNVLIDSVPVADLWMERNKKDKLKAKSNKEVEEKFDVDDNLFADFDEVDGGKDGEEKAEKDELHIDDYYDELYEKTKMKNLKNEKKRFKLEKALKEVKLLRKKTAQLEDLLKVKESKKRDFKSEDSRDQRNKHHRFDDEMSKKFDKKKHLKHRANKHSKNKKTHDKHVDGDESFWKSKNGNAVDEGRMKKPKTYYDKVFKETKWNDLIDWGTFDKRKKQHGKIDNGLNHI